MRPIRHIGREHTASPGWPLSGLDGQWLLLAGLRLPAPGSVRGRCESSVAVSRRPVAAVGLDEPRRSTTKYTGEIEHNEARIRPFLDHSEPTELDLTSC